MKQNKLSKNINKKLEKSVLQNSNSITTISSGLIEKMKNKIKNDYNLLQSGVDEISVREIKTDKFIILFLGSLSKYHNIIPLLEVISLLSENVKNNLELKFVGKIFSGHLNTFKKYKNFQITIKDYLPYKDAMNLAKRASILFNPIPNSSYSKSIIGAKTYDYLSLRKPILVLSKEGNAIKKILNETESGRFFKLDDDSKIREFISEYYKIWLEKKIIILNNKNKLEKYTTKYNVGKLVEIFDKNLGN